MSGLRLSARRHIVLGDHVVAYCDRTIQPQDLTTTNWLEATCSSCVLRYEEYALAEPGPRVLPRTDEVPF